MGAIDANYLEDRIHVQKYDDDASQETVCYTHTLYNQGGVYEGAESQYDFYNIYYGTEGDPPASQPYRIASIPTGYSAWFDWLADPDAEGRYGITSVDRYGNESAIVYP
jgi:hypothetical protein